MWWSPGNSAALCADDFSRLCRFCFGPTALLDEGSLSLLIGKKGRIFLKRLFQVIVETKRGRRILWKRQFENLKRTRPIRKKESFAGIAVNE